MQYFGTIIFFQCLLHAFIAFDVFLLCSILRVCTILCLLPLLFAYATAGMLTLAPFAHFIFIASFATMARMYASAGVVTTVTAGCYRNIDSYATLPCRLSKWTLRQQSCSDSCCSGLRCRPRCRCLFSGIFRNTAVVRTAAKTLAAKRQRQRWLPQRLSSLPSLGVYHGYLFA